MTSGGFEIGGIFFFIVYYLYKIAAFQRSFNCKFFFDKVLLDLSAKKMYVCIYAIEEYMVNN